MLPTIRPIIRVIPIRFREIGTDHKIPLLERTKQFFQYIRMRCRMIRTFRGSNLIIRFFRIPHTKTIVMFRGKHEILHSCLFCQISPIPRIKLHRIKCLLQIHVIPVIFIIRNRRVPLDPIYIFRTNSPRFTIPFLAIRSPVHEKTEFQILPLFQFCFYRRVLLLIIFHTLVLSFQ